MNIGITGQIGFIGTHLTNYLKIKSPEISIIDFKDEYFENQELLQHFTRQCDVIVHLAALNRHHDPKTIYETNVLLVKKLISALESQDLKPHLLFSSSIQEERDNPYGNSKREGRKLLEAWAKKQGARFTGFLIPNVFGPFGNPFYNSVIATFSHQIAHGQIPKIEIDAEIPLIYINDLVTLFHAAITGKISEPSYSVPESIKITVSDILKSLNEFKAYYLEQNIIPFFKNSFEISLFNTFRCFIDPKHYPVNLDLRSDNRGQLIEIIKSNSGGQVFFSSTKPGVTRGNHFHTRKIERFCVVQGEAVIRLRRVGTNDVIEYPVSGEAPGTIDMPVWYTHNITNIGTGPLLTLFWTNEMFNPNDTDTFFEDV